MSKLLLGQGIVWSGGVTWRPAHHVWLGAQRFGDAALQAAYDSAYEAVVLAEARRARLDRAIASMAADSAWTAVAARLGVPARDRHAHRVRLGGGGRRPGAVHRGEYRCLPRVGADRVFQRAVRSQGPITKTGNSHARRLLVEAARHHRTRYRPGATMQARWQRAPAAARARGDLGNQRLNQRCKTFTSHHKKPVVANVAVARELAGWC